MSNMTLNSSLLSTTGSRGMSEVRGERERERERERGRERENYVKMFA